MYNSLTDREGDQPPQDIDTLQKLGAKKREEKDWDGLLRAHKLAAKKPTGRIGLDYHYTLVMKILSKHLKVLPEPLSEDLFKTLVASEIGPVSVTALKAILRSPQLYIKALPYLSDSVYSIFSQVTIPEHEMRQYIKSLIASKHISTDNKSTALLMKLLQSQPHPEQWLEEVTLLGQETGHNEECGRLLALCDWRDRPFAKKYLINLAKNNHELFGKIAGSLNADSLALHLVDMLRDRSRESIDYTNLLIPVVLKKLSEINGESAVFE